MYGGEGHGEGGKISKIKRGRIESRIRVKKPPKVRFTKVFVYLNKNFLEL